MTSRGGLFWLVAAIAVGTVLAGVAQLCVPHVVLRIVGGPQTDNVAYVFAIVGMFMALFGGMTIQALFSQEPQPIVLLWASLQKVGAALAVGLGVQQGRFGTLALAVAVFDFCSGIVILVYRARLPRPRGA